MGINLTNIPPKKQATLVIPLQGASLRHSLECYLVRAIPSFVAGSVFRLRQSGAILYRCRLNPEPALDLERLASILQNSFPSETCPTPASCSPCLEFDLCWEQPLKLDLSLPDDQLLRWLAHLWQSKDELYPPRDYGSEVTQDDFPLQYAHARCWSAIQQQQIPIAGNPLNNSSVITCDRILGGSSLQLTAQTRSLIHALLAFVDQVEPGHCPKRATLILLGRQLGHAALEYLRYAALPSLAESFDLGLIMLVQRSLQWLLEECCGVSARREL